MFKERCIQLTQLEQLLKRDVFMMCHNRQSYNAMIDGTMINVLRQTIRFSKKRKNVALIIQTSGGYADEAMYICKFFREYYDSVDTYIVGDCYSGGTIIALSSDNVYMNRNACLGPIDVQFNYNDEKDVWNGQMYSMINALEKVLNDKDTTPALIQSLKTRPGLLALYAKIKYSYKDIVGKYVKKHCVDEASWEKVWHYLAELNFSHGSSLTYKRCVELGLDVKRMPKKVDEIVSRLVRDAEDEFGGLMSKSILHDFYETTDGNVIKSATVKADAEEGREALMEISVSKSTEILAVIETAEAGYVEEMETAVTLYGLMPVCVSPIKSGWREEYNTTLVLPEQGEKFEDYIDDATEYTLAANGFEIVSKATYNRVRKVVKKACYDEAIADLKESGEDVDAMSSSEKWKAVVEYCLEQAEEEMDEDEAAVYEHLRSIVVKIAADRGINYDDLSDKEADDFFLEVLQSKIPELAKQLGCSAKEVKSLALDEQYELLIEYLLSNKE